ncbi:MAG: hypothetical protein DMD43_07335 [Gemmatimonadetes bacterium]|nr:MAG: hypothetical protein DMD43_07335 [Gemmatimonadota bacterium]
MTSPYERPDTPELERLERLLALVEEELAGWRARCLKAEQEVGQRSGKGGASGAELQQARQRIGLLESENRLLHQRIAAVREQIERLRTRIRFVEEHGTGDAA